MAKLVNLTDKFSKIKPQIQIAEIIYDVNDSMETIIKFQELANEGTLEGFTKAFELALGKPAVKELKLLKMSQEDIRVIMIGIMASARGMEYDEAEKYFRS